MVGLMTVEEEIIWNEAHVAFEMLSRHLNRGTEENHKKSQ
jgi:hypothetical protein